MKKIIQHTKKYTKALKRLPPKIRLSLVKKTAVFLDDEFSPNLRTHPLKGRLSGHFAFSITDDVRVVYKKRIYKDKEYIIFFFMDIGGHEKVY